MIIRGQDSWGAGHYGASRDGGKRKHLGIDIINHVNEAVCAYENGRVTTIKTTAKRHYTDISKFLALMTLATVIFTLTLLYKLNKLSRKVTSWVQRKISE